MPGAAWPETREGPFAKQDSLVNEPLTATCQCIIAHPAKAKFLALRHSNGYLPPQIKVPEDASLATNVGHVLDGVRNKYGLRTTLLRHVALFRDYHCIELEMHGKDARRMEAIWVGLEDYRRMRGTDRHGYDPLAAWLEERESGKTPPRRPPWERAGWFAEAGNWIQFQLDRLNLQITGSVAQHRALQHSAAVLRVPTSSGQLYFKAAYDKPPLESRLHALLSRQWPEQVPAMLAVDHQRNWMLLPDLAPGSERQHGPGSLARAAAAMGRIQAESTGILDALQQAGCSEQGAAALEAFLRADDFQQRIPELPEAGLSEAEREDLGRAAGRLADSCGRLADCGVPDTLVHPDFRAPNFFVGADSVRIIDWEDASIAPPFFTLLELLREERPAALAEPLRDPVVQAWMEPLARSAGEEALQRGLDLALRLQPAWRLKRWIEEFDWLEPGSTTEINAWRFTTGLARRLIAAETAG